MYRARRLERALGTPARIYFKYEGVSPAGSHKPNTSVPQAFYNAQEGIRRLTTETGAGQWGTALAFASSLFGIECEVWQVRASYDQKPYRKSMMEVFGGVVHPSPSDLTEAGRKILADDPDSPGSLGIAISEAVEIAAQNEDIGATPSAGAQPRAAPDRHRRGGHHADGDGRRHARPRRRLRRRRLELRRPGLPVPAREAQGNLDCEIRAVEPAACPTLTRGIYTYDFGDTAGMTPLLKMHTLGHDFVPDPIHAGGLRYHGMSPLISHVYELGLMTAEARQQSECFAAGVQFARTEGIVPAPEPTHALASTIDEARRCAETGEEKVILTRCAATVTSTSPPTTSTSPATCRTSTTRRSASTRRSPASPTPTSDGRVGHRRVNAVAVAVESPWIEPADRVHIAPNLHGRSHTTVLRATAPHIRCSAPAA
ncbi:MAG: TrpB-like pyridoxal-phosphate dependent enzyme [Acidimicrobiales bacterium]